MKKQKGTLVGKSLTPAFDVLRKRSETLLNQLKRTSIGKVNSSFITLYSIAS